MSEGPPDVAIVDYGMGNLFSVKQACERAGLRALMTSSPEECIHAAAVILPGVGAFGDAMATLTQLGLVGTLRDLAASGKPMIGICLGMQLLMSESHEFGRHRGLGIVEGEVVRFDCGLKVPQVGWNRIHRNGDGSWDGSWLDGIQDGEHMYFVHSFYVKPADPRVTLSRTRYGSIDFCSSLRQGNVLACQFHPERSGPQGIHMYRNIAAWLTRERTSERAHA